MDRVRHAFLVHRDGGQVAPERVVDDTPASCLSGHSCIDLKARVEVHTAPSGPVSAPAYRERHSYGPTKTLPPILGGHEVTQIAVRELLP